MYLYEGGGAYAFHLCHCISPSRRTIALLKRIPLWNMLLHSWAPQQGRRTSVCLRRAIMTAWPLPHPPGARATQETQQWLTSPEHRAWKRNIHEKRTNRSFKKLHQRSRLYGQVFLIRSMHFPNSYKNAQPLNSTSANVKTLFSTTHPPRTHTNIHTFINVCM